VRIRAGKGFAIREVAGTRAVRFRRGWAASGTWYLQDRVIVAEFNFMLIGAAFYRDRYRRASDGWKISSGGSIARLLLGPTSGPHPSPGEFTE
jgi:SnoaL-like domain